MQLPDQKITMVHRSDGSGTSFVWTDYLSKVSSEWANGPGKGASPNWPAGVGGKGNEGVAGLVRQLPGAIGYVELIYALQNHIGLRRGQERSRKLGEGIDCERHRRGCKREGYARRLPGFYYQCARCRCLSDQYILVDHRSSSRSERRQWQGAGRSPELDC